MLPVSWTENAGIIATMDASNEQPDRGAAAGRPYLEHGEPVTVVLGWRGKGPRNVLIRRDDGSLVVRPFRGLRRDSSQASSAVRTVVRRRQRPAV